MKSPRRLPSLPLGEDHDSAQYTSMVKDDDAPNPFYLGSTGKTPRPTDSVQQALRDKMKDFVLQTGGGFASVDLRKIHKGPALIPEGIITIGKRPHVLQKGPPKALAQILHRLNRKRSLITRYFADQTLNRWKVSLLFILFRAWANVTSGRPKSIDGMLQFIKRARGRGVRFWFNRWHQTHNKRCRENIRMRELKLLNEHRLRLLEIETNSLEAQQVNGLVASDLQQKKELVKTQEKNIQHLNTFNDQLSQELKLAKERLLKLDALFANPAMFIPERTAACLKEWDTNSRKMNMQLLHKIEIILKGLMKRPWQNIQNSVNIEEAAKVYRAQQLAALERRREEEFQKINDPFKFNNNKYEHHVNPIHPKAETARLKFWEKEVQDMDIHHLFQRLKQTFKSKIPRTLYGKKIISFKSLFHAMDVDHSGTISRMELWEGMQRLDLGLTILQIRTVLHAVDADNSGTIDYSEFKAAFKKSKKKWKKWIEEKREFFLKESLPTKKKAEKIAVEEKDVIENINNIEGASSQIIDENTPESTHNPYTRNEDKLRQTEEQSILDTPASRTDRDAIFRLRWFESLSSRTNIILPEDLRNGKLWSRVLDKLSKVSVFKQIFEEKQYIKVTGQERNKKRRVALVVKNLRKLGIYVPRTARTPAGFLVASDEVHLSIANEVLCRFPGLFISNGALHKAFDTLESLKKEWEKILKVHHVVNSRLDIIHSFGNISNVDELYIHELDKSQTDFFNTVHRFQTKVIQCYDNVKKLETNYKGGERRMLQFELSSSLENSNRLLQHIEQIQEAHKQIVEAENTESKALSAEEDRRDLLRYSKVPNAWKGTVDERDEIEACLTANSIEARKIFRYYSNNGTTLSIDDFFELAYDASLLSEVESDILVQIFKITVEARIQKNDDNRTEKDVIDESSSLSFSQLKSYPFVCIQASSEQFVEICLRLAKEMRPHMNVADGLQDIWDEYMSQTRPPKDTWSTVRKFMNEKNIRIIIESRRPMMYEKFQSYMNVLTNVNEGMMIGCISRDGFYNMCLTWGHIVRGIPPGDINLMFSHATGTFDFEKIRQQKCPMVFPQFVIAIAALFLRGGVDPFLDSSSAFALYLHEHLGFPKPEKKEDENGNMVSGGVDVSL
jgi:hypothetical protein